MNVFTSHARNFSTDGFQGQDKFLGAIISFLFFIKFLYTCMYTSPRLAYTKSDAYVIGRSLLLPIRGTQLKYSEAALSHTHSLNVLEMMSCLAA